VIPLFINLKVDLDTNLSLADAVNGRYDDILEALRSPEGLKAQIYIDEVDDPLRTNPRFLSNLAAFVRRYRDWIESLVLACRRSFWTTWPEPGFPFSIYHTDYFEEEVYVQLIADGDRRREFFESCGRAGLTPLLELPFHGFYLAREFEAGNPLPVSRHESFQNRISNALVGTQDDHSLANALPLDRLRMLSQYLAVLTSFTRHQMWTLQEAVDLLGSANRFEPGSAASNDAIRTLLGRPLFVKTGDHFSFAHQLFQEFLAAELLADLPLHKQRQLLEADAAGQSRSPGRGNGSSGTLRVIPSFSDRQ
jgi:hypothetical protein